MNDQSTTVERLKNLVADFVAQRDWGKYHRPKNLAMSMAIETAELMEHFQWLEPAEAEAYLREPAGRQEVSDELADVLAFVLSFANASGIDLAAALEAKMAKNEAKYPAEKVRGHYQRPKRIGGKRE